MRAPLLLLTLVLLAGCPDGSRQAAPPASSRPPATTPATAGGPTIVGQIDRTELKVRMMKVKQAAQAFKALEGRWPKQVAELVKAETLAKADALDPWDRDLLLEPDGAGLQVKTLGKDGQPGGDGLDADLSSNELF